MTCGQGIEIRTRACTNPPPQFGGNDCVGDRIESRNCNIDRCPGKFLHLFFNLLLFDVLLVFYHIIYS